ncbi:MAG: hypothetical protein WC875_00310 [Candidatus Absconditabacterales bacterium]
MREITAQTQKMSIIIIIAVSKSCPVGFVVGWEKPRMFISIVPRMRQIATTQYIAIINFFFIILSI